MKGGCTFVNRGVFKSLHTEGHSVDIVRGRMVGESGNNERVVQDGSAHGADCRVEGIYGGQ